MVNDAGSPLAGAYGAVPDEFPQTAAAGEWLAAWQAAQHVDGPAIIHQDCSAVLARLRRCKSTWLDPKAPFAGVARRMLNIKAIDLDLISG